MKKEQKLASLSMFTGIVLALILALGSFLRLYNLDTVPPAASLDEASIGYNAYSLLLTGKDEYGTRLPILLRAYDDYRPALYVYVVLPFITLLGPSVTAVRLPSAIGSVLIILFSYLLARELFGKNFEIKIRGSNIDCLLIVPLLVAISPVSVYMSRLGHEVNAGTVIQIIGIWGIVFALRNKYHGLLLVFFSMLTLTVYTYQSYKLSTPLLLCVFAYISHRVGTPRNILVKALGVCLCVALPILLASVSEGALLRAKGTFVLSGNSEYAASVDAFRAARQKKDIAGMIYHFPGRIATVVILKNAFSHLDARWIAGGGLKDVHKTPGYGLLYWWQLPFLLLGILFMFRGTVQPKHTALLYAWLVIAMIPGSLTNQAPHVMRLFAGSTPLPEILVFVGLAGVYQIFTMNMVRVIAIVVLVSFSILQSIGFVRAYFEDFPRYQSDTFQYALAHAVKESEKQKEKYEKIIVSNEKNLYQSYMFYLFYTAYDPRVYLASGGTYSGGYEEPHTIGKYEFRRIVWEEEPEFGNYLYIGNIGDFPPNWPTRFTSANIDGTYAVYGVTRR